MGGEELLRSVARFQKEMLRKREEQGALLAKEPKSQKEKGGGIPQFCSQKNDVLTFLASQTVTWSRMIIF